MKKLMKTLAVLSMVGTMAMAMGINVNAADITRDETSKFSETGNEALTGVDSFYLIKDYDSFDETSSAPNSNSPAETFTYTITPYGVWNAGSTYNGENNTGVATAITKDNMPMLGGVAAGVTLTLTQDVNIGDAKYETAADTQNTGDKKVEVTLPTYSTVGDYWYKVEETIGTTTGVLYGTNDAQTENTTSSNGAHNATYYIHVQVTETSTTAGTSTLVRNVTMHKNAPQGDNDKDYNDKVANNQTNNPKVNAIENRYYAGDLVITKKVTGNAGDKDEYFEVTVTFTKPAGTIVNSDITYTAFAKSGSTYTSTEYIIKGQNSNAVTTGKTVIDWSGSGSDTAVKTATATIYVKDNDTVTFSNIPYGITYSINETQPTDDTYENEMKFATNDAATTFDGQSLGADTNSATMSNDFTKTATGSISDASDTVTIENKKVNNIDIGVILDNAPFIAMLGVAVAGSYIVVRRKKETEE